MGGDGGGEQEAGGGDGEGEDRAAGHKIPDGQSFLRGGLCSAGHCWLSSTSINRPVFVFLVAHSATLYSMLYFIYLLSSMSHFFLSSLL